MAILIRKWGLMLPLAMFCLDNGVVGGLLSWKNRLLYIFSFISAYIDSWMVKFANISVR